MYEQRFKQRILGLGRNVLSSPRREVPEVTLWIPGRIFPLAVRLVCGRRIDGGSGTSGMMIVSVYIIDEDNETARLRRQGPGRD